MGVNCRKRKDSFVDIDCRASKRPRLESISNLQNESRQDLSEEFENTHQTIEYKNHFSKQLIRLMYRLQLSVLCSVRKLLYQHKYDSLSIKFQGYAIDKFSDIVIYYKRKSVHVHIEYVDNHSTNNYISYSRLFNKQDPCFSVNYHFDSFVKHILFKSDSLRNKIKYLVIFTNSSLDITEKLKLNTRRSRTFYTLKFDRIDIEKCDVLKDFLFTTDPITDQGFYQFSQDENTRNKLLNQLEFSSAIQKVLKERQLSEEFERKIKVKFLNKLVFAVKQPNREELKYIIKNELVNVSNDYYVEVQEQILNNSIVSRKIDTEIIYHFNLLISACHDMFLNKKISSMCFKNSGKSSIITISYKDKLTYIKTYNTEKIITYSQLFPPRQQEEKSIPSINKYFALYLEDLEKIEDIKFCIIYTNTNLDIEEEKRLKNRRSKDFYPLKFDVIDIQKKRYKVLRNCSYIQSNGLYQFSKEEQAMLLSLLRFPPSIKKEKGKIFDKNEKEIKENFLRKLIFATNQSNIEELNGIIKNNISKSDVPYTYEELQEVTLRWSEYFKDDSITERIIQELLEDIKNNRSSYQKTQNTNISGEIKSQNERGNSIQYLKSSDDNEMNLLSISSSLPDELDHSHQISHYKINFPQHLIGLMYRLQLSVLCLIRNLVHEHEYNLLSIIFEDFEIDKFSDIVIHYKNKYVYVHIEYVDNHYMDNDINYSRLFAKKERYFSVNNYFDSFVKYLLLKSNSLQKKIKYLVIFTNSSFDITEEMKLNQGRSRIFYPFKFDRIDIEKCYVLKDFLFTTDPITDQGFYQFSQDEDTRNELLNRLEFSSAIQKVIKERQLSEDFKRKIKVKFLNKLVFAVNQPNREDLKYIIKNELVNVSNDYIELKDKILNNLSASRKVGSAITYEFVLLLSTLHDMFVHKKISFTCFKSSGVSNVISICYKDKLTYIKAYNANKNISYSLLFPPRQHEYKSIFSINKHFALFLEELEKNENLKFFIIYTNTNLDIKEANRLKKSRSKDFHPLKFDAIDIQKKKYKVLRYCSYIKSDGLYQFAKEDTTLLLSLLKLPSSTQKETKKFFYEREKEIKEKFLNDLIFAINQPNMEEFNAITKNKISKSDVPYTDEELHEVALRWSESPKYDSITERVMRELLEDIKNNRSSFQKILNENISEEIKFAKSVIGMEGSPPFNQFLCFLTKGEGKKILEDFSRNSINLVSISSILNKSGSSATKALKDLHNLWFDGKGNTTLYLKTLQENGINLSNLSSVLRGSGSRVASAFENLFHLWFDKDGNKTQCLQILEKERISLTNMTSILSGAASHTQKAFKDLYDLWFDEQGNKTQYLTTLEENDMNLVSMSSILHMAGSNAAKAFKDLYDVWFDEKGNKTQYLKAFENEGINLENVTSILNGAGSNAAKTFKNLYNLWFNEKGKKVQYLKNLQENGLNLANISSIIRGTRSNSVKVFENLHNLWFDEEGKKTRYLISLENEGLNLTIMSGILSGAGSKTSEGFKNLYDLWFDQKGRKTKFLKTLEENGIDLVSTTGMLRGAGYNAAKAFKDLYNLWFDKEDNKTQYLKTLKDNGISLLKMSHILRGAGSNTAKAFKVLHNLWFDEDGNKTQYLKTSEEHGINLSILANILSGAGFNAAKAFKNLHNLWFDEEGNQTRYLEVLEKNDIHLVTMCNILSRANSSAAKAFKNLFDLWFDKEGNKTKYLKTLEENEITMSIMAQFLYSAGSNAAKAFENLYDLWFDKKGNKTQYLKSLEKYEIKLTLMSGILYRAGTGAAKSYKTLCDLWFDKEENQTHYLKTLKDNGVKLTTIFTTLYRSGNKAAKKFLDLYKFWFDEEGNKTENFKHLDNK